MWFSFSMFGKHDAGAGPTNPLLPALLTVKKSITEDKKKLNAELYNFLFITFKVRHSRSEQEWVLKKVVLWRFIGNPAGIRRPD